MTFLRRIIGMQKQDLHRLSTCHVQIQCTNKQRIHEIEVYDATHTELSQRDYVNGHLDKTTYAIIYVFISGGSLDLGIKCGSCLEANQLLIVVARCPELVRYDIVP
jgi:hypothetical protein